MAHYIFDDERIRKNISLKLLYKEKTYVKILILLICAILALSLWGCGEEKEDEPSQESSGATFRFITTDF